MLLVLQQRDPNGPGNSPTRCQESVSRVRVPVAQRVVGLGNRSTEVGGMHQPVGWTWRRCLCSVLSHGIASRQEHLSMVKARLWDLVGMIRFVE